MALIGDLKTFSFVDVLQIIAKDKKNGILIVEWPDLTVAYYVKDGEIIFARPVDRAFGIYTDRDFDVLLEKLRIPKENIYKTVERFLVDRLHLKEGVFSFVPGFIKYSSDYPVVYPIENIIMMASRHLTPEEVERKISDEMMLLEPTREAEEKLAKVSLIPEEKKVFSLVNGQRTVADIRRESGFDNLTVDRALYGFLALGAIKRKRIEKKQKPPITIDLLIKIIERIRGLS